MLLQIQLQGEKGKLRRRNCHKGRKEFRSLMRHSRATQVKKSDDTGWDHLGN